MSLPKGAPALSPPGDRPRDRSARGRTGETPAGRRAESPARVGRARSRDAARRAIRDRRAGSRLDAPAFRRRLARGFQFLGLPALAARELPTRWLDSDVTASIVGAPQLRLGPEPLLPAQQVVLHLDNHEITIGTDGLSPFQILDGSATVAAQ